MISNREDRLVRFAFGDVNEQEQTEIEALIARDPDARRTVDQYAAMRSDFGRLREVPEDQMSRERLRDAILARGLKSEAEPEKSRWGWMWMPVAACTLAFAYMMMPRPVASPVEPMIVSDKRPNANVDLGPTLAMQRKQSFTSPVKKTVVKSIVSGPEPRVRKPRPAPEPVEFDRTELVRHEAPPVEPDEKKTSGLVADNDKPKEPEVSTTIDPVASSNSAPIVIVEPSPGTGTNAAQEVESVSNVLVGG
ncbi:hypothetical protein EON81_00715 [bacterium]|nr:MAG: hypothetical protein EON81_00715 [bacterium]